MGSGHKYNDENRWEETPHSLRIWRDDDDEERDLRKRKLRSVVKEVTGFTIGGVSPVAHLNPLNIYIDQSLSRFKNIYGAAGHPNCIFKIDFVNLQKITNGKVMDISEWKILGLQIICFYQYCL